jgi:sugar lactone lactonase YvrE
VRGSLTDALTQMENKVELAMQRSDKLGECPIWDDQSQSLYWVDSRAPALYRLAGAELSSWALPETVGSFGLRRQDGLILALQSGIYAFDWTTTELKLLAQPEADRPTNRFNDGRCDRHGRFWAGTMSDVSREPLGSLYRLRPNGSCARMFDDIIVPNSISWSPNNKIMYFADTYKQCMWIFDFEPDTGEISHRRVFRDTRGHPGKPDGSAVDAEGCLWNCEYGGWRIVRYNPTGKIDRIVPLPVANPTCCAFGGSDFRTLFVTSATQRLTPQQLAKQPLAGSVFAIQMNVGGLPEARFGG